MIIKNFSCKHLTLLLAFVAYLVVAQSVCGQEQKLWQMAHTSWTGRDDAPQSINSLAQTPDGLLWIGTTAGLFTFDGISFAAFHPGPGDLPLPSCSVRRLFVSRHGELWVPC